MIRVSAGGEGEPSRERFPGAAPGILDELEDADLHLFIQHSYHFGKDVGQVHFFELICEFKTYETVTAP